MFRRTWTIGNRRRFRGAVAVTAAISVPFLIGFSAIAIDMGYVYNSESELQAAVDAASIAGAKRTARSY